jgi:26S proteasome regulatory subunit T3
MDGFDQTTNVKVIMATNRQDTLDPALLLLLIFSTITAKMNLSDEVDLEDYVARPDRISGADINAICQEAGMHAVRENMYELFTNIQMNKYTNS